MTLFTYATRRPFFRGLLVATFLASLGMAPACRKVPEPEGFGGERSSGGQGGDSDADDFGQAGNGVGAEGGEASVGGSSSSAGGRTNTGGRSGAAGGSTGAGGSTSSGAGGAPSGGGPASDCFDKPTTHFEIINACTDAVKVEKSPDLLLLNPDGTLPEL